MDDFSTERWRGRVDARIDNVEAEVTKVDAKAEKLGAQLQLTNLELKGIATKIGTIAAVGAVVGGGIMSVVIKVFFHQ